MGQTSDVRGAQRAPVCGSKDINLVDGTHVSKVRDPAINQYESFDAFSPTSMSNHGKLAGLCRRRVMRRLIRKKVAMSRWMLLKIEGNQ